MRLPRPEQADVESIQETAKEVLCGCMEWSFGEAVAPQTSMAQLAKEILSELENVYSDQQDQATDEKLRSLRNLGEVSLEPRIIEVTVPDGFDLREAEHYERLAMVAYEDLQEGTEHFSLGGYVTLADSNLEKELNLLRPDNCAKPSDFEMRVRYISSQQLRKVPLQR